MGLGSLSVALTSVLLQPALDVQFHSITYSCIPGAYGKRHDLQVVPSHQSLAHFHPHLDLDMLSTLPTASETTKNLKKLMENHENSMVIDDHSSKLMTSSSCAIIFCICFMNTFKGYMLRKSSCYQHHTIMYICFYITYICDNTLDSKHLRSLKEGPGCLPSVALSWLRR